MADILQTTFYIHFHELKTYFDTDPLFELIFPGMSLKASAG